MEIFNVYFLSLNMIQKYIFHSKIYFYSFKEDHREESSNEVNVKHNQETSSGNLKNKFLMHFQYCNYFFKLVNI